MNRTNNQQQKRLELAENFHFALTYLLIFFHVPEDKEEEAQGVKKKRISERCGTAGCAVKMQTFNEKF